MKTGEEATTQEHNQKSIQRMRKNAKMQGREMQGIVMKYFIRSKET